MWATGLQRWWELCYIFGHLTASLTTPSTHNLLARKKSSKCRKEAIWGNSDPVETQLWRSKFSLLPHRLGIALFPRIGIQNNGLGPVSLKNGDQGKLLEFNILIAIRRLLNIPVPALFGDHSQIQCSILCSSGYSFPWEILSGYLLIPGSSLKIIHMK